MGTRRQKKAVLGPCRSVVREKARECLNIMVVGTGIEPVLPCVKAVRGALIVESAAIERLSIPQEGS